MLCGSPLVKTYSYCHQTIFHTCPLPCWGSSWVAMGASRRAGVNHSSRSVERVRCYTLVRVLWRRPARLWAVDAALRCIWPDLHYLP